MASYIAENRPALSKRHYIRKATAQEYWFSFYRNKMRGYQKSYGDRFCLVLYGSEHSDDAYVMPFGRVKVLFPESSVDQWGRWMGSVADGVLRVRNTGLTQDISAYYNAFHLLQ